MRAMLQLLVLGTFSLAWAAPLPDKEVLQPAKVTQFSPEYLERAVRQLNIYGWKSGNSGWDMSEEQAVQQQRMGEWQSLRQSWRNGKPIPCAI